jgi:hypothetical protein
MENARRLESLRASPLDPTVSEPVGASRFPAPLQRRADEAEHQGPHCGSQHSGVKGT